MSKYSPLSRGKEYSLYKDVSRKLEVFQSNILEIAYNSGGDTTQPDYYI